jgi:DNA polymerase V
MHGVEVGEVWGVGPRITKRLAAMGITSVLALRNASPKEMRTHFGVVMERTCNELRGISCLELEDIAQPKKQIMSSRSFGAPVETLAELRESVASYLATAAEKLRRQKSAAGAVYVFLLTNRFKEDEPQYNAGITVPMPDATDSKTHPVLDLVGNGPVCPPYVLLMGLAVSLDDETCRRWLTRDRQDGRDLGARTNLEAAGSF